MKRAVLYLRVSTSDQTTANQERELREVAERMACDIVKVYRDHGISGAKGRDKRPAFDKLCREAARREFEMVMAWSVDRLGRSLQDLIAFLSEIHALHIDLYLHQQGLDSRTPATGHRKTRNPLAASLFTKCKPKGILESHEASRLDCNNGRPSAGGSILNVTLKNEELKQVGVVMVTSHHVILYSDRKTIVVPASDVVKIEGGKR
jgi:hypothetical protein